jgi:hypothetical protein
LICEKIEIHEPKSHYAGVSPNDKFYAVLFKSGGADSIEHFGVQKF